MTTYYKKRAMVSLDGYCPMQCKHCFTYEINMGGTDRNNVPEDILSCDSGRDKAIRKALSKVSGADFDIIYISETNENFFDDSAGAGLCSALYRKYGKDIFIITRRCLSEEVLDNLSELNQTMKSSGNRLYLAASCFADQSYGISENVDKCPSPKERLKNLKNVHERGICTLLLIRPVFPEILVPIAECKNLVSEASSFISAVVSSGLVVTDGILKRFHIRAEDFKFMEGGDSDYLANMDKESAHFIDVEKELGELQSHCDVHQVPFFRHSMPALNYIAAACD